MHCLEVIEARNDRAAGREAAHASRDGNFKKHDAALTAAEPHSAAFIAGYETGKEEN